MMASTASTKEGPQSCSGCEWCEKNKGMRFTSWRDVYTSKEACFDLKKFLKAVVSSPDGLVKEDEWNNASNRGLPEWFLIPKAIMCRRKHEENIQIQRRELFLQQQQQSSPLGSALFSAFPINLMKHIASYLAKPSQALFAVSLGNFDMSSIAAMSTATDCIGGQKRNSDGSLREETSTAACLADIPAESLRHIVSFLPGGSSQALFGLTVAAANDELLNKNSFAIVDDQCWEDLDFGEIERELAARLTDDDIKAVLLCINAANKVKRLSLAHCVNIIGTCLEPLRGSTVIEQIDLSLVGRREAPILLELWHPPQKIDFVVAEFEPPLSCEIVLPILDSIIGSKQCSLQHLRFPKAWRENCQNSMRFRSVGSEVGRRGFRGRYSTFKPDPAFVSFLSRYNQVLMNRGRISCVNCTQDLPSSGYELVGSSVSDDDRRNSYTFGQQNQTCSQCTKHYCYRCDDHADAEQQFKRRCRGYGEFLLERCGICEKDQCVDCSGMYRCEGCHNYYCVGCKEGTACGCGKKMCSDCNLRQCGECKESICWDCSAQCEGCDYPVCESCYDCIICEHCLFRMCNKCASETFDTCQQCKDRYCGCGYTSECQSCNQTFCQDCLNATCDVCENFVCDECDDFLQACSNDVCGNRMCKNCASAKTCQLCKGSFCCGVELTQCQTCNQSFCQDCATLRQCGNLVPGFLGHDYRCSGYHCIDCPDESYVEVARTCSEVCKRNTPCDACKSTTSSRYDLSRSAKCARCSRTSCKTWQSEKKLMDDLNESLPKGKSGNSQSYEAMFTAALEKHKMDTVKLLKESAARGEKSVSVTAIGEARKENVAVMRRANELMSTFIGRLYRTEPQINAELSRSESDAVQLYIGDAKKKHPS